MRQLPWCLAVAGTLAGPAAPLVAQGRPLDTPELQAYVRQVLDRNAGYRAVRLRVGATLERIAPAGALPDPMLTVGAMSVPIPSFDLTAEAMTQFPVMLQQRFPFPGKQGAATAVARADNAVADAVRGAAEAELAAAATRAWFELAYARAALDVWAARVVLANQAIAVAQTRYETGAAPQIDLLRARLRRSQLTEERQQLEAALAAAAARADALRGSTGDSVPTVLPAPGGADIPPADLPLATLLGSASPLMRAAAARADRAERTAQMFRIAARPDFTVSLGTGVRFGGREPFLTALVGISVPLWAGRKQAPAARAAVLDAEAAQAGYDDLLAQLVGEARSQLAMLDALHDRIAQSAEEIVPLAEAASASALQRYQVGDVEFSTVLDTQDDVFRARLHVARLIADHGAARARFAALVGEEWYR